MPYIKQEDREKWVNTIEQIVNIVDTVDGQKQDAELNFLFSSILKQIYHPRYFNFNRAIGMLECMKQEYYRTVVGPYEEEKRKENGDI